MINRLGVPLVLVLLTLSIALVVAVSLDTGEPEPVGQPLLYQDLNLLLVANSSVPNIRSELSKGWTGKSHGRTWWNSCQSRWDGVLPDETTGDYYIYVDITTGRPTQTDFELEDRESGRPSAVWDDANLRLWVVSFHIASTEFWSFTYDCGSDAYAYSVGETAAGVVVTGIASEATGQSGGLTITPDGDVWVSILNNTGLLMQHSTDNGVTWERSATILNSGINAGCTDAIWFENSGTNYVLIIGTEDDLDADPDQVAYFISESAAGPNTPGNWTDDSSRMPAFQGTETTDDHCSLAKDSSENIYMAIKTGSATPGDGLILLYDRTPEGIWTRTVAYIKPAVIEDNRTRPCIIVDSSNNELYLAYAQEAFEDLPIFIVKTSTSTIRFGSEVEIFHNSGDSFSNPLCPDGVSSINSTSNLLMLAENTTTSTVWYNELDLATFSTPR